MMDDDTIKAAATLSEVSLSEKLERYLARGRPLQGLSREELLDERRRGLVEWAQDPALFDERDAVPGDDATAELSLRGMHVDYSEDEEAILARAVEKLMPAHNALSLQQREAASDAMMDRYREQRAKRN